MYSHQVIWTAWIYLSLSCYLIHRLSLFVGYICLMQGRDRAEYVFSGWITLVRPCKGAQRKTSLISLSFAQSARDCRIQ